MTKLQKKHAKIGMLGTAILLVMMTVLVESESTFLPETNAYSQNNQDNTNETWDPDRRPVLDHDSRMVEIEKDIPGFGGVFMGNDGRLTIFVVPEKADHSQTIEERKSIMGSHIGPYRLDKGLVILEGQYAFPELFEVKNKITSLIEQDLGITMVGIDDMKNMVMVGIETSDKADLVREEIAHLGISKDIVYIKETGKLLLSDHMDKYRPMKGGIQLQYDNGTDIINCSLGMAADDASDDRVIVTAGHCRHDSFPDGTAYFQNSYSSDYIGSGISGTNPSGPRYSDTVLISPTVTNTKGAVHHDSSGTITLSGKQYTQITNDSVTKSGRTTHDTIGEIIQICTNLSHATYGTLYCQIVADYDCDLGDSGGTVYGWDSESEDHKWFGVNWGCGDNVAAYSPVWNIEQDQGTLTIN